jgi:hypothetical protein
MGKVFDRFGNAIKKGCKAMWWDFAEDVMRGIYEIYEVREDIIYLSSDYGEAECPPSEVIVVDKNSKDCVSSIKRCPFCGGTHVEYVGKGLNDEDYADYGESAVFVCHDCDSHFRAEL